MIEEEDILKYDVTFEYCDDDMEADAVQVQLTNGQVHYLRDVLADDLTDFVHEGRVILAERYMEIEGPLVPYIYINCSQIVVFNRVLAREDRD